MKRAPVGTARCCAGFPSPAEQYQEPPLDLNELLVKRPAATYFVRVEGDSMVGAGISTAICWWLTAPSAPPTVT